MITVKEFKYDVRALVDEYNDDGQVIPDGEVADIEANIDRFLPKAMRLAYDKMKLFSQKKITKTIHKNLLGTSESNFAIHEFKGTDLNYPEGGVSGAKSYFFTVDSDFTAYIEELEGGVWNTLETITEVIDEATDYSGSITVTTTNNPVRIRFSGTTYYRFYNRCLYEDDFKVIPEFKKSIRFEMDDDFAKLDRIVTETPNYDVIGQYYWEGRKTLVVDYEFNGTITVIYKPIPPVLADNNTIIPVYDPQILEFLELKVASWVSTTENTKLINFYNQLADEAEARAFPSEPASEEPIVDVYGIDEVIF